MSTDPTQPFRIPWRVAIAAAAVGILAAIYWLRPGPERPPPLPGDSGTPLPPLTVSPFLNTAAGVQYVGDAACVDCHADQCRSYRRHPMGRSLFAAADDPADEPVAHPTNPFRAGPFHFQVIRDGKRLVHKEWCEDARGRVVVHQEAEVAYVVGSGTQARGYLVGTDGFLFESPICWFQSKGTWGPSPGYEHQQYHFTRRIDSRCLFCHSDRPRPIENTTNRYRTPAFEQTAIGCERCHGPGQLHVAGPGAGRKPGEPDWTIVNPKHLPPALRDNVCEQCHLQGEAIVPRRGRSQFEYRPGLPLHEYMSVFVRAPETADASRIVTHFEQMRLSACYRNSAGRFTCTSCHDPHGMPEPAAKVAFYRGQCLNCHDPAAGRTTAAPACSLPLPERTANGGPDNCVACHMPRNPSSNANHLAVTDHRVLRRPGPAPQPATGPPAGAQPLVHAHAALLGPDDEARTRDLGIALMDLANFSEGKVRDYLATRALPLLDQAAARAPDDVPALEARGFALHVTGQSSMALEVLAAAVARAPDRESTLTWAAHVAGAANQLDLADDYARRLVSLYPEYAEHRRQLAVISVRRQDWPRALEAAEAAVRLDPFGSENRAVLISVLLATGDHARARAEFDVLGALDPAHQERIRPWFEQRLRK